MSTVTRSEILEMLAEGKISTAEALKLLDRKGDSDPAAPETPASVEELKVEEVATSAALKPLVNESTAAFTEKDMDFNIAISDEDLKPEKNGDRPRWLKIRVKALDTGRNKVSVTLPLAFVNFGFGVARRFGADFDELSDIEEMWRNLKDGQRGDLINVEDEEDNEQVQIYLE